VEGLAFCSESSRRLLGGVRLAPFRPLLSVTGTRAASTISSGLSLGSRGRRQSFHVLSCPVVPCRLMLCRVVSAMSCRVLFELNREGHDFSRAANLLSRGFSR